MNAKSPLPSRYSRGSALLTVILFTFMMCVLVGSILGWSLAERRLNVRNAYWIEARTAAEALAEYGTAQVQYNFITNPATITYDPKVGTTATNIPLDPSPLKAALFRPNKSAGDSHIDTSSLALVAGFTSPATGGIIGGGDVLIDSNDPSNAGDPYKNWSVSRSDVMVVAKATAVPPDGSGPVTAYVSETVSLRGGSFERSAIFYANNDLEVFPGPQMDVYGPVHVNGNLFINSGNSLNFHDAVTTTGNVYHAWADVKAAGEGSGGEALKDNDVTFATDAKGNTVSMYSKYGPESAKTWNDSTMGADQKLFSGGIYTNTTTAALDQLTPLLDVADFQKYAQQTFNGYLQTGGQSLNPAGFTLPIDSAGDLPNDDNAEKNNTDGKNISDINDPPDQKLSTTDAYYAGKHALEQQKFSNKADVYISVQVTAGSAGAPDSSTITLYGPGNASNIGKTGYGPNGGVKLGTVPSSLVSFVPYSGKKTTNSIGAQITKKTDPNYKKYPVTTTTTTYSASGSSTTTTTTFQSSSTAPSDTSNVTQGLYDQRQQAGVNLVQIDMKGLSAALTDTINSSNSDGKAIVDSSGKPIAKSNWNGVIYVDIQAPTGNQTSLGLANGQVAKNSSLVPPVPGVGPGGSDLTGLTIATNAPVYIEGHFNADGTISSDSTSATTPDDGGDDAPNGTHSAETPVGIVSDATTILSPQYFGKDSSGNPIFPSASNPNGSSSNAYNSLGTLKPTSTGSPEVAATFVTGLVQTSDSASSGGVHNLPRFLEDFGSSTVAIRGSLVSLYHSKFATGTWSTKYYSPPKRVWGYDQILKYVRLPGFPALPSLRRIDFHDLSASGYTAALKQMYPDEY